MRACQACKLCGCAAFHRVGPVHGTPSSRAVCPPLAAATWEEKARLAISKGREDLARAALQEKHAIEDEVASVAAELNATDEHISQLNEEVAKLQQSIVAMTERLEQRASALEEFARHVSHEFKTPISTIKIKPNR